MLSSQLVMLPWLITTSLPRLQVEAQARLPLSDKMQVVRCSMPGPGIPAKARLEGVQVRQGAQQKALADAGRPPHEEDVPGPHREADVRQDGPVPDGPPQAPHLQHRPAGHGPPSAPGPAPHPYRRGLGGWPAMHRAQLWRTHWRTPGGGKEYKNANKEVIQKI